MTSTERAIEGLARRVLGGYRLSPAEFEDETRRLAEQIQVAVDAHLESLEHLKA